MLTQEDLQAIGALIKTEGERLDLKLEAGFASNKKDHAEIMETLVESNETTGRQISALEKRVSRVEEHTGLGKTS